MRSFFSIMMLVSITIASAQTPATLNLMPVPKSLTVDSGKMPLTSGFRVAVHAEKTDTILYKAVNRMYQHLNRLTGIYLKLGNLCRLECRLISVKSTEFPHTTPASNRSLPSAVLQDADCQLPPARKDYR